MIGHLEIHCPDDELVVYYPQCIGLHCNVYSNAVNFTALLLRTSNSASTRSSYSHFIFAAYYESLQDKLAQLRDAREALDSLREEHHEKRQREVEEMNRLRQMQMMQKLEVMRQKKHVSYLLRVCDGGGGDDGRAGVSMVVAVVLVVWRGVVVGRLFHAEHVLLHEVSTILQPLSTSFLRNVEGLLTCFVVELVPG